MYFQVHIFILYLAENEDTGREKIDSQYLLSKTKIRKVDKYVMSRNKHFRK